MKLLANENIPLESVRSLRIGGYDVVSISERSPGISDEDVIQIARTENRIVITLAATTETWFFVADCRCLRASCICVLFQKVRRK